MARLQILELPEGTGDDRPPFVLVVDQITEDEGEAFFQSQEATNGFAAKVGARAVVAFHGVTVDIPANEAAPVDSVEGDAQTGELIHAHEQTRLALCDALLLSRDTTWHKIVEQVAERQREVASSYRKLDEVTEELGMAIPQRWEDIRNAVVALRRVAERDSDRNEKLRAESLRPDAVKLEHTEEIRKLTADLDEARGWARHGYEIGQKHCSWSDHGVAPEWLTEGWPPHIDSCEHLKVAAEFDEAMARVRGLPEQPEIMDAQHPNPHEYLRGYSHAINAAKRAARNDRAQAAENGG